MSRNTFRQYGSEKAAALFLSTTACLNLLLTHATLGQEPPTREKPASTAVAECAIDLEQLISWLPENTESIMVVKGQAALQASLPPEPRSANSTKPVDKKSATTRRAKAPLTSQDASSIEGSVRHPHQPDCRERHFGSSLRAFRALGKRYTNYLRQQPIRFVLRAGRPAGDDALNALPYEACTVFVFDCPVVLRYLANDAEEVAMESISGKNVIRVDTEYSNEGARTTYYSHPRPGIVIAATDARFLKSVLDRAKQKVESRALPERLREWQFVNTFSPVWGLRHLAGTIKKGEDNTTHASPVGFTFSCEHGQDSTIVIHCVTSEDKEQPASRFTDFIREFKSDRYPPRFVADGVVEITLPADSSSDIVTEALMGYPVEL